ncbi:hypothetical protein PHJA_001664800 [Phtheirospermum japonicum]|uniref:Uncharacterized protein n=1 Tax=Phtheirospermum japonicum TaxID=374723 RepID=A0A830CFR2_9LAMI|nr:hypothetical protein PHJA_001664800 [Phtheirospermum japonicum]
MPDNVSSIITQILKEDIHIDGVNWKAVTSDHKKKYFQKFKDSLDNLIKITLIAIFVLSNAQIFCTSAAILTLPGRGPQIAFENTILPFKQILKSFLLCNPFTHLCPFSETGHFRWSVEAAVQTAFMKQPAVRYRDIMTRFKNASGNKKPNCVSQEIWEKWLAYWSLPEVNEKSEKARLGIGTARRRGPASTVLVIAEDLVRLMSMVLHWLMPDNVSSIIAQNFKEDIHIDGVNRKAVPSDHKEKPDCVSEEVWEKWLAYRSLPEVIEKSEKSPWNRYSEKAGPDTGCSRHSGEFRSAMSMLLLWLMPDNVSKHTFLKKISTKMESTGRASQASREKYF